VSAPDLAAPERYTDASRALLRERVLDAVHALLEEATWSEVSMAEVAKRAGTSRQTLYNAFGGRRDLAHAYIAREVDRFLAIVASVVAERAPDAHACLASALEIFLAAAGSHPLVRAISIAEGGDELLAMLTTRGAPAIAEVPARLAALLGEHWPELAQGDAHLVAERLVRLAISHAGMPSGSPARTAADVGRVLGPFLDQLLR
jgi:AcrR family transcriptional regulator